MEWQYIGVSTVLCHLFGFFFKVLGKKKIFKLYFEECCNLILSWLSYEENCGYSTISLLIYCHDYFVQQYLQSTSDWFSFGNKIVGSLLVICIYSFILININICRNKEQSCKCSVHRSIDWLHVMFFSHESFRMELHKMYLTLHNLPLCGS